MLRNNRVNNSNKVTVTSFQIPVINFKHSKSQL